MTSQFRDRFDRADGAIGSDYTIVCGNATIFDGAVLPVTDGVGRSGLSPQLEGTTDEKTQVLYTAQTLDNRDYVVRMVWSHDPEILGERPLSELPTLVSTDPAMTALARMSKDPMLVDLGRAQDPSCHDQGYGIRVTCPRTGALPSLKIVKFIPPAVPPGIARPTSTEPDGAIVLASVTLQAANLIVDPGWDETGNPPYRGFFQETRLRIRFSDERVTLDVFHNDRNMHTSILEYTDQEDPAWGDIGLPGFEFLSPQLNPQPSGVSPFQLAALPIMRCHLFEVATIKAFRRPVSVTPQNFWTYDRVIDRVILLVEKNGDARYTATGAGTKRDTYLQFVVEAESHIVREVGYYEWQRREAQVRLKDSEATYELPEDVDTVNFIRPSWDAVPLDEVLDIEFARGTAGVGDTGGRPRTYRNVEQSVNNRPRIQVHPIPRISSDQGTADDLLNVEYFARPVYPSEPDIEIPLVPQQHMDVLIYGATTHALLLDQDSTNAQLFAATFKSKLAGIKRDTHRKVASRDSLMRSAGDVLVPRTTSRFPPTRAGQLEGLL